MIMIEINTRCRVEPYHLPVVNSAELVKGLCDGVRLGAKAMAGFPSMETIDHSGEIKKCGVKVFNTESRCILIESPTAWLIWLQPNLLNAFFLVTQERDHYYYSNQHVRKCRSQSNSRRKGWEKDICR
jgi:hypothetical protein